MTAKTRRITVNATTPAVAMRCVDTELSRNPLSRHIPAHVTGWEPSPHTLPDESVAIYTKEDDRTTFIVIVTID